MFFSSKKSTTSEPAQASVADPKKVDPHYLDDEPEVDYDAGATQLYKYIEDKNWDKVLHRIETSPHECKAWIFRRESSNPRKIRWRLLPIHASCIFRSPLSVIEALVGAYPDGTQMKDDQDMLPIHLACRNGASKGVVSTLLYAFPDSITVLDRKGRTPMHLVEASSSQNREAVMMTLKKFQKDMEQQKVKGGSLAPAEDVNRIAMTKSNEVDYDHRTLLFRHVIKKDWNSVEQRCESHGSEASTWIVTKGFHGNLRFLPLHKACVLQPRISTIHSLLTAFPEGSKSKDQDGWLPIHCACFYGASNEIVDALLVANPNGAHSKDDEGRMPLHYATLKNASEGVISSLLRANPKAAVSKDDEGRLPVHHACSKGSPDRAIEALLKVSPKGAQSKDDQGRLPLHHICRKNGSERIVKTLLTIFPRAAQVKDDQEKLPIHYACQNGASEQILDLLLTTSPDSINVQNGFGHTPLEEAKSVNNTAVVKYLEKFQQEKGALKPRQQNYAMMPGTGAASCSEKELKTSVVALSERVEYLESLLKEVSKIGVALKESPNTNGTDVEKLAEKLAAMKPESSEKENSRR